jgi:hypothetical protein
MISPKLLGRTDIAEFESAAKRLHNFLPAPMGGVFSRPGTVSQLFIDERGCVIPWERSDGRYLIIFKQQTLGTGDCPFEAFDNLGIRKTCEFSDITISSWGTPVVKHDALIEAQTDTLNTFETLDYYGFSVVTIENNLVLTHNSGTIPPLVFYVGGVGITIEHYQFSGYLPVSSSSGNVYSSTDAGLPFQCTPYLINKDSAVYLRPDVAVPGGQEGLQTTSHVTSTISAFVGDTATPATYFTADMLHTYFVINQNNKEGVFLITSLVSASVANCIVIYYAYNATIKSYRFRRQLFAPDLGFPKVLSAFNNRLIFANTLTNPNWFWCSKTNTYKELISFVLFQNSTTNPITEVSSFELPVTSKNFAEIKWISQQGDLLIGTGREEFVIKQGESALSIQNIGISPESSIGGSYVSAIKNSESAFFVSSDGKRIHQVQYNFQVNGFSSKNISILNDDLIQKIRSNQTVDSQSEIRIVKVAWQESNRILWALTNSFNLFSVTIEPNSETVAWAYHTIGSECPVVDMFTFFSETLERSILGLVVSRTDGYFVEYMAPEYLGDELETDSLNIGDQPVFADGSFLISTLTTATTIITQIEAGDTFLTFGVDNNWIGLAQRFPTGKKVLLSSVAPGDATIVNGAYMYVINLYDGYGFPLMKLATSLANALAGIAYSPTITQGFSITDAEPTAKYTKWGTFARYSGETVDVIADGILYEDKVIGADGILTLPVAVSKIVLGFRFTGYIETLTPDTKGNLGSTMGSIKRVDRAYVRYYKSRTGKVGSSESNLSPVVFPEVPFTGAIDHFVDSSSDREWSLMIKKEQSLPLNVMSVTIRGQTNE